MTIYKSLLVQIFENEGENPLADSGVKGQLIVLPSIRPRVSERLSAAHLGDTLDTALLRGCSSSRGYTQGDARPRAFPHGPGMVLTS